VGYNKQGKKEKSAMTRRLLVLIPFFALLCALGMVVMRPVNAQPPSPTPIPTSIPFNITPPANVTPFAAGPAPTIFFITTVMPTGTPGCPAPLPLAPGFSAVVSGGVYVRTGPSASTPFVNYYPEAVTVTIQEGPVCDGSLFNWWRVSGPGQDGWVAEGRDNNYLMRAGDAPTGTLCEAPVSLTVGGQTLLQFGVRVRQEPAIRSLVLTVAPAGATAAVLEGPICEDGYNWWRVNVVVAGIAYSGWMADFGNGQTLIADAAALPPQECTAPRRRLAIGITAYVDYNDGIPKNMRVGPGLEYEVAATLLDGIGFTVLEGPVCMDGYNWWRIQILPRPDVIGWLADAWITPTSAGTGKPFQ
jgi:uncharacterized protein YraI